MYSLVMLVAMTAGPDVPQDLLCPVNESKYGCGFWSKHCFYDCCAPARYGWVTCWTKGFGYYPGGACGCAPSTIPLYRPSPCACSPCGTGYAGCGKGCGFCGYGWPIGDTPAYYTSVLGCPPHLSAPPYACGTNSHPCCSTQFAFDTGLAGHSHGVGYAGFGGYGNFGFYGAVPMMHRPSTFDLPPFPRIDDRLPASLPAAGPAPMPPLPGGGVAPPAPPPVPDIPVPPPAPDAKKDEPKKDEPKTDEPKKTPEPKKAATRIDRPAPATVILCVPAGAAVTVDGQDLRGTGRERTFGTPPLAPGKEYAYTVRVVIVVEGKPEVETQEVKVTAGEISRASFEKLFARTEADGPSVAGYKSRR